MLQTVKLWFARLKTWHRLWLQKGNLESVVTAGRKSDLRTHSTFKAFEAWYSEACSCYAASDMEGAVSAFTNADAALASLDSAKRARLMQQAARERHLAYQLHVAELCQ